MKKLTLQDLKNNKYYLKIIIIYTICLTVVYGDLTYIFSDSIFWSIFVGVVIVVLGFLAILFLLFHSKEDKKSWI